MCDPGRNPKGQKIHDFAADPLNLLNPNKEHYSDKKGKDKLKYNLIDPGGVFDKGGLLDQSEEPTEVKKKKEKRISMPTFDSPDLEGLGEAPQAGDADKAVLRDFRKRFGRRQTILTGGQGDKGPVRRRRLFSVPDQTQSLLGG